MQAIDLAALWLPIVVTGVAIFFASFLAWMVLPHHKGDFKKFPREDELLDFLRSASADPGPKYMFPHCSDPAELKDPEKLARWKAGPHGILEVWPGMPSMARNLPLMFVFYLVVGLFVAYLSGFALGPGAEFRSVFRVTATAAFAAFALGAVPNAVWFAKGLRPFLMDLLDNIVYAIITGLVFAWLWPAAPVVPVVG